MNDEHSRSYRHMQIRSHRTVSLVIVIATTLISYRPLAAQRATATVSGTATDPSGSAIPEAAVRATNQDTGVNQATTTDSQGRYRLAEMPIGRYSLQASKEGFQTLVQKDIVLNVGEERVADFALPVGQATQTV